MPWIGLTITTGLQGGSKKTIIELPAIWLVEKSHFLKNFFENRLFHEEAVSEKNFNELGILL